MPAWSLTLPLRIPHPWLDQNLSPVRRDRLDIYVSVRDLATRAAVCLRRLLPSNFKRCLLWCMSRSKSGATITAAPRSLRQSSTDDWR